MLILGLLFSFHVAAAETYDIALMGGRVMDLEIGAFGEKLDDWFDSTVNKDFLKPIIPETGLHLVQGFLIP